MSEQEKSNELEDEADQLVMGFDDLSHAVLQDTVQSYRGPFGIFILFILKEDDGYTVCFANGDPQKTPMGETFTRYLTLVTLGDALTVLAKVKSISDEALA